MFNGQSDAGATAGGIYAYVVRIEILTSVVHLLASAAPFTVSFPSLGAYVDCLDI